jgi:BioD-like phosphotransacetylase family protein
LIVIYLVSSTAGSGKTAIAAGLGKYFLDRGTKTGYFKPVISANHPVDNTDAALMRRFLNLEEAEDAISPGFKNEADLKSNIMSTFMRVAAGKEVVIVEAIPGTGQSTVEPVKMLQAKIIGVEAYAGDYTGTAGFYKPSGMQFAGVILNKVPVRRLEKAGEVFTKATGIKVSGTVPEERTLTSITVAGLAQEIKGKIIGAKYGVNALIENVMLGAMVPDHGEAYYGRKTNKAVIIRSERSDMQLAALETPTRCLVLAGKKPPMTMVTRKAEDRHVPIITTEESIAGIIAAMEKALSNARLTVEKLDRAAEVVGKHVDMAGLETLMTGAD